MCIKSKKTRLDFETNLLLYAYIRGTTQIAYINTPPLRVQANPAQSRYAHGEPLLTEIPLSFPDSEVIMHDSAVSVSHHHGLSFNNNGILNPASLRHSLYRSYLIVKKYITVCFFCQSSFCIKIHSKFCIKINIPHRKIANHIKTKNVQVKFTKVSGEFS